VIKINEIFYDLEGEGKNSGYPTLFIRVTGCNLRCKWCDTKYAYYKGKNYSIKFLANKINKNPYRFVNITGGEPLLYKKKIKELLKVVKNDKFITIETNGSISIKDIKVDMISMDLKLPSSGENEKMLFENLHLLSEKDQLKLVIGSFQDMQYAKKILEKYKTKASVIAQPVYKKFAFEKIEKFILKNKLNWKFSIQLHKIKSY